MTSGSGRVASSGGSAAQLPAGVTLGKRVTLVQFSSAFCQPCRATRRILEQVIAEVDLGEGAPGDGGIEIVHIDADENLELTRLWEVSSTPTVVFLDADGREVCRGSGQPRPADVIASLGRAIH